MLLTTALTIIFLARVRVCGAKEPESADDGACAL